MPNQSPSPVAGAVEALIAEIRDLQSRTCFAHEASEQTRTLFDRIIAALHPQPAPAVAVEAERELFERQLRQRGYHYFDGKLMGPSQAAVWEFMSAGTEHAWQGWLAARSAPAVAEKVPLTETQIERGREEHGGERFDFAAGVRFAERAHGIGSGSAQEGQANG